MSRGEKLCHNLIAVVALRRLALWDLRHILPALPLLSRCAKEVLDKDRADQTKTGIKVTSFERNCHGCGNSGRRRRRRGRRRRFETRDSTKD